MWKDANWWYLQHKFNKCVWDEHNCVVLHQLFFQPTRTNFMVWQNDRLEKDETDTDESFIKFIPRMKKKIRTSSICLVKKSLFIISEGEQITSTRNKKENRWLDSVQDWASWAHFVAEYHIYIPTVFLRPLKLFKNGMKIRNTGCTHFKYNT